VECADGFRFRENQNRAEKIIAGWCSEALGDPRDRETIAYQRHKIHIFTFGLFSLAIVSFAESSARVL